MFYIHMGVPEMQEFWNNLRKKVIEGKANNNELKIYRKLGRVD